MTAIFEFKCSQCEKFHKGPPSVAFPAPAHYFDLTDEERKSLVSKKTDDFCIIGEDRFVRVCLEIPIQGLDEGFLWGVWVSLSEVNYNEYYEKFHEEYSAHYFGWFCNNLAYYEKTLNLPTTVHVQGNKGRPLISINTCEHEIFTDFTKGISQEKAGKIMERIIHA